MFLAIICQTSLSTPVNGIEPECDGNKYGSSCTFSCIDGFTLSGATTITCGGSGESYLGQWSAEEPSCTCK